MGSGGGGGGGNPGLLTQNAAPMQGLPIAGKDSTIGSPYDYGKFQNFLPDIPAEGPAPSATGLKPDMFTYRSPSGKVDPSQNDQIQELRNTLAQLQASQQQQKPNQFGAAQTPFDPFGGDAATSRGGGG
jgi:hypothetical protein